jgi:hypothetical protein
MWPKDKLPEPTAGLRLLEYGCKVKVGKSKISRVRKIKTPDDIRPGTRKGKIDFKEIWLIKIAMPKKLMSDIKRGYKNLDINKVEDIINRSNNLKSQPEPVDQLEQE